ncbi:hypothetical protein FRC03_012402 [Tulasnella sp. 419]|nr:hypothetical protein FRC03_012402 [Tulasnella sp. 419]
MQIPGITQSSGDIVNKCARSKSPAASSNPVIANAPGDLAARLAQLCRQLDGLAMTTFSSVSQVCDMLHAILRQEQAYFDARSSGKATEDMIRQVNAFYEALYDYCLEELGSRLGPFFYDHIADRAHMIYPSWCLWICNNIMSHVARREDSPIDQ